MRVSWRSAASGDEETAEVAVALRMPSAGAPAPLGVLLLSVEDAPSPPAEQGEMTSSDQELLVALSSALAAAGFTALRCGCGSGDINRSRCIADGGGAA